MYRSGFTLIELLIVVVIIGILAAIAIPKVAYVKERAYVASMKTDLRNLVTAEEAYFSDSVKYTNQTDCGNPPAVGAAAWCPSQGNSLAMFTVSTGTQVGWTARETNLNTPKSCAVYVGVVKDPADPATLSNMEGVPVCR